MESPTIEEEASSESPFLIPRPRLSREFLMVLTICLAQAFVQACFAQGLLPDGVIGRSFGVGEADRTWGPAGFALTTGTFMLPAGRVSDMYGHRRCFVAAYIWFAIASLITGLSVYSKTFIFYSVCRGLQGIACAMLVPCALAILGSIYKEGPRKNLVFSLYAAGSPVGYTIGIIFSAILTQLAWWPWMFYAMAIACLGLAIISYFAIPKLPGEYYRTDPQSTGEDKRWRKDFDWLGSLTGVAGLILFNVAWNRAPSVGWQAPDVIATLVVGFALCVGFIFVEKRVDQPLVPVNKLGKDAFLVLLVIALGWASFGVMIFYLVNFTLKFRHDTLIETALQALPVPFAGCTASYLNTFLLGKGMKPTDVLAISLIWFTVGCVLLATLPVHQTYWKQAFWIYVLAPFGMDLSFPSSTLVMSKMVPPEKQGIAASLIATVVYYSQSIGLGIAGTVQAYISDPQSLKAYRGAFYTGIGLSGFGLLTALWPVLEHRLRKRPNF